MRRMQTIEKVIGENTFYIRPFGAFAAANISGELAALLSPILAGIAPLFGGLDMEDGGSDAAANPLDMDIEEAMPAISSALSTISGDKVERMMRRLLIDQQNISVQGEDTDGNTVILDKDLADEVFCGELQDTSFNRACIKIASLGTESVYTVAINGAVFSYSPTAADTLTVLKGIAAAITDEKFTASVDETNEFLNIEAADIASNNVLILSENLTTETVTSIITFGTEENGDILIPGGVITNIVNADAGLLAVENLCGYIAGRDEETDVEFRQSYVDKIFNRSSNMLESIRSAILLNVQGVRSVAPYENATHQWYVDGTYLDVKDVTETPAGDIVRPPHSVEIVVDGGDSKEIAQQILANKAGGINTVGETVVVLPGEYDEEITIRFNRPTTIYTWFRLGITLNRSEALPPNYVDLLREAVLENMDALDAGKDVVPQQFMSQLYKACSGISYIDIQLYASADASDEKPSKYPDRSKNITARQRAYTKEEMIEVEIDG